MNTEIPESFDLVENPVRSFGVISTVVGCALGSAADGKLFGTDTHYFSEKFGFLSVYIRSDHYLDEVLSCFNALLLAGFGAKSSTGLGAFQIIEPPQQCDWLSKL